MVLLEVFSGAVTKEEARRIYKIGGNSTILDWMCSYAGIKMKTSGSNLLPTFYAMKADNEKSTYTANKRA